MLYVPAYMNVISNITIISQQPQFFRDKDKPVCAWLSSDWSKVCTKFFHIISKFWSSEVVLEPRYLSAKQIISNLLIAIYSLIEIGVKERKLQKTDMNFYFWRTLIFVLVKELIIAKVDIKAKVDKAKVDIKVFWSSSIWLELFLSFGKKFCLELKVVITHYFYFLNFFVFVNATYLSYTFLREYS